MSAIKDSRFLLNVSLDVAAGQEALFNEVYDAEHVPALLAVPGVISIWRYRRRPLKLAIGGAVREFVFDNEPKYTALYEIESPEVLTSDRWARAVETGRWPEQVRPHTRNRRHTLHELIGSHSTGYVRAQTRPEDS